MRRWIVDLGAVALLAAGAVIFIVGNVGWPDYWATVVSALAGMGALSGTSFWPRSSCRSSFEPGRGETATTVAAAMPSSCSVSISSWSRRSSGSWRRCRVRYSLRPSSLAFRVPLPTRPGDGHEASDRADAPPVAALAFAR